jgi:hypothetical protein
VLLRARTVQVRVADAYAPEVMREFRKHHQAHVTGNVAWHWSCSCGKGGRPFSMTEGVATAARDRHLRAEHRKFIADLRAGRTTLPGGQQ